MCNLSLLWNAYESGKTSQIILEMMYKKQKFLLCLLLFHK